MKLSEQWLHEWVKPSLSREALANQLTMAGLEVESVSTVAEAFSDVVVGEIIQIEKHPEADRLKICKVNIGQDEPLTIVCGGVNARANLKVAVALVGAKLPNNFSISRSKIRNVVSYGMLCSPKELGMAEESAGIMELPSDAPIGEDLRSYLHLSDYIFDISITPNRGDCLSVLGMAKEIAALTHSAVTSPKIETVKPIIQDTRKIIIDIPQECPRYVGRVIKNVKADAPSPIWLQERLKRSGIRTISAIVDIMNYVMLELGQPMHAFDLAKIHGNINVKKADKLESLTLLDGQTVSLTAETMVISDDEKPLAIAGVMGGLDSGVTLLTEDIFLESAFFDPKSIAYAARHYHVGSESSYRFERGIDPLLQSLAIERATQLILDIAGGKPGPIIENLQEKYLPSARHIALREEKIKKLLGFPIESSAIESILKNLEFTCVKNSTGWDVTVPARRSDITLEVDLIEEVIRLFGYDQLPSHVGHASLQMHGVTWSPVQLRQILCDLGYQEVITYSFIDKTLQQQCDPHQKPKELINPITSDMSVMRTNLWPGLINTYLYNYNRQQPRVRIFEAGLRFIDNLQQQVLSGLISDTAFPLQWGHPARSVDFFDLKGDLEKILSLLGFKNRFTFKSGNHPALHSGQTAEIILNDQSIGFLGALHPELKQALGIDENVFVFELLMDPLEKTSKPTFHELSKFPEIRRDIAIFLDQSIPVQAIQDTIAEVGGSLLKHITLFDVYQGKGVATDQKSIALALILQHESRTLVDEEVTEIMEKIIAALKQRFAAELR